MLRFILQRSHQDEHNGASGTTWETFDCDVPNLEAMLKRGGRSEGGHDLTHMVGVEILNPVEDVFP